VSTGHSLKRTVTKESLLTRRRNSVTCYAWMYALRQRLLANQQAYCGGAGGNYVINERGRFTLRDGEIAAVPGPPVLVVSDLDDTMIGDDGGTAVFKRFWEKTVCV